MLLCVYKVHICSLLWCSQLANGRGLIFICLCSAHLIPWSANMRAPNYQPGYTTVYSLVCYEQRIYSYVNFLMSFSRCIPDNKRAFAMGLQYVFLKTIGLIPGPIIFGHLLDLSCKLWQNICGHRGRCFVYDVDLVGRNICAFGAVTMGKDNLG